MPSFAEFYQAINKGRSPFPWQDRLAGQIAANETWPREIGVPTGLGKTACLDMAIWWLASQAERVLPERTAPTRIWWVVNRRLLVDSTAAHADTIARALDNPDSPDIPHLEGQVLLRVANRLRSISARSNARPLDVIRLRGGIASQTPVDPSQPTVILCTLPMYGSRLLFRGYGSRSRPVDAAMAGVDSLVLLDEAHLAPHLRTLLRALADCTPNMRKVLAGPRSRSRLVALTATGDEEIPFQLDQDDYQHSIVQRRLDAPKLLEVRTTTGKTSIRLAEAVHELISTAEEPSTLLAFANAPKTARETFERLRKDVARAKLEADVLLLTGLTREREAERIRRRILDPATGMAATREPDTPRQRHLVVVATQTLEVGADIDAEYLVTEGCGVRALTQRLGRLNRLGLFATAKGVYVHLPPPGKRSRSGSGAKTWPVYGEEPKTVLRRLQDAEKAEGSGTVNLSPRRVASVLGPTDDHPGRAPEILPGILWEWCKTTTPPEGEAPVEPYFSGIADPGYSVSVIWRAHVPRKGDRLWPRATDREAVDVPVAEVRRVLADETIRRLAADRITVEEVPAASVRPGDQLVLPVDRGLLDAFGWNPDGIDAVVDVSLPNRGLPLDADAIKRLCGVSVGEEINIALGVGNDDVDITREERQKAASEIIAMVKEAAPPEAWDRAEWASFVGSLTTRVVEARKEVPRLLAEDPARESPNVDLDEMSLGPAAVDLDEHGRAVARLTRNVADAVGLPADLIEVVEFAGRTHDAGKADRRFQRWLRWPELPDRGDVLVAKSDQPRHRWSTTRAAAGWPLGGRHEDLSARLVLAWLKEHPDWGDSVQRGLLLHLIISHHGKGRPLVAPAKDGFSDIVHAVIAGSTVRASSDLAVVDWKQPDRFQYLHDYFGPWGLALLEAILICSDHAISAGLQVGSGHK